MAKLKIATVPAPSQVLLVHSMTGRFCIPAKSRMWVLICILPSPDTCNRQSVSIKRNSIGLGAIHVVTFSPSYRLDDTVQNSILRMGDYRYRSIWRTTALCHLWWRWFGYITGKCCWHSFLQRRFRISNVIGDENWQNNPNRHRV